MIHLNEIDNDGRGENTWELYVDLGNKKQSTVIEGYDHAIVRAMGLARHYKMPLTIHTIEWYYDQDEKGLL